MSIELYDTNGSLGQAATNSGFGDARRAVEKLTGFPELKKLFAAGITKVPKQAGDEAMKAAHLVRNHDVRTTLVNISELLRKAKKEAIVQI